MAGWLGRNVLVVSPTPTAPVDFGNRRYILNSFKRLQEQGARIIFVYYPAEHDWRGEVPADNLHIMQSQWDEFYIAPVSRPVHSDPAGSHHEIDEWWDDALGATLNWVFATHRIDACIVNYTWLTRVFTLCPPGVLRILDTHDRFAGRKEMLEANGIRPEFFYLTEEREREALLRCDLIWAIKEDEAAYFRRLTDLPTLVFPHVERPELAYRCRVPRQAQLRFGFLAARNEVNFRNYHRFFRQLEIVARQWLLPARFLLAGSMCDMLGPDEFPFLERLGRVDTVEDFYLACDVVVVPMSFSTGLKIKVGEAVGYGKAVIAHAHAFDGFEVHHRFQALDNDAQICGAIITLIDGPEEIDEMERASIRTSLAADRVAEHCVANSIGHSAGRRRFIVLAPADLMVREHVVDHLSETCRYLGFIERPALYVTGDSTAVPAAAWRQLARQAELFAEPAGDMAARGQMGSQGPSFLAAEVLQSQGCELLYAIRVDAAFRTWSANAGECVLRLEDWGSEAGPELAQSAAALHALPDRLRRGLITLGSTESDSALRAQGVTVPHVLVPLLRDAHTSSVVPFICEQRRLGVGLIVAGAAPAVVRNILSNPAFKVRWAGLPRILVMTEQEQEQIAFDDLLASFDIVRPGEMLAYFHRRRQVPTMIVQLGPDGSNLSWLREACTRAVLPFVSLARDALADGVAANHGGRATPAPHAGRARQVLHVLDALFSEGFIETEKAAMLCTWPYMADSGWAWLWRLAKHGMRN